MSDLPAAAIRTQVVLPLRFADGYVTEARAFTFDGLVDSTVPEDDLFAGVREKVTA